MITLHRFKRLTAIAVCFKFGLLFASPVLMIATVVTASFVTVSSALAARSAVVLMYHRFGESEFPSTNTTLEQLEVHIRELTSGKYTVLPLPEIVDKIRNGEELPDRTVGISIDDAYLSTYTQAWPRLKAAGLPFTLFVSTAPLRQKLSNFMSWDQLREMAEAGITIGSHTVSHLHMPKATESDLAAELKASVDMFQTELGFKPRLFSYPYGETSLAVETVVKQAGIKVAFGQHSGAFDRYTNPLYLPRFAINEKYGDLSRLRLVASTLSIPATDITPADSLITSNNPPAMGFTVSENIGNLDRLTCFMSHVGKARIERLGTNRIEVRVETPLPKGRSRSNCTLIGKDGRVYWLGRQFYNP